MTYCLNVTSYILLVLLNCSTYNTQQNFAWINLWIIRNLQRLKQLLNPQNSQGKNGISRVAS